MIETSIGNYMMLKLNARNEAVGALVEDLRTLGYYAGTANSLFDSNVRKAVLAFQMQSADSAGRPLKVDGVVGPITRWAMDRRLGRVDPAALAMTQVAAPAAGSSARALAALAVAVAQFNAVSGEAGGDNRGPDVRRYLHGLAAEGSDWCAGFVSYCFAQSGHAMPFTYSVGARDILHQMRAAGMGVSPIAASPPRPGDIIVWWRGSQASWKGHIGLVLNYAGGVLTTIEGNKTPKVGSFSYSFGAIEKLLGFARAP